MRVNWDELDVDDSYRYTYEGKPFTGIGVDTDKNGNVVAEISFVDGVRYGLDREFYASGQLMVEVGYCAGAMTGWYRSWHENGQLF